MNNRRIAACLLLLLTCQGCAELATYGEDRVRDLSDVVDVRYGTGFGLGVQIEWYPLATGLGCSLEGYSRTWFGRKSVEVRGGLFAHGIIFGVDGTAAKQLDDDWKADSTGFVDFAFLHRRGPVDTPNTGTDDWFNQPAGTPPVLDQVRVGAVVFLPGVNGGAYFNLGELIDFFCGVAGYDMMHDDGIPKFRLVPA